MDEHIELLNKDGVPNGERCLKSIAHKKGLYHASVHIWFYTSQNNILIQKRHTSKDTFPNLWDVSVAGHISYKELPIEAAIRETKEEIGASIKEKDLKYIGSSTHKYVHSENLIDFELHHIYICELKTNPSLLITQDDEVEEIKLISIDTYKEELINNPELYVPHGTNYYQKILEAIKQIN